MAKLYYAVNISNKRWKEEGQWVDCDYRLLSPLPFPAPLETEIFFNCEDFGEDDAFNDTFYVTVRSYRHALSVSQDERRESDDLYMELWPDEKVMAIEPEHPGVLCRFLEANGWEKY